MAINRLEERRWTQRRSMVRLKRIEDELKEHLAALRHEHDLILQCANSHLLPSWIIKLNFYSWNQVLTPGSSTSENIATLERKRDAMLKKAKEYHRELAVAAKEDPVDVPISLEQLISQKEKNVAREKEVNKKRAKLETFQGLPPVRSFILLFLP